MINPRLYCHILPKPSRHGLLDVLYSTLQNCHLPTMHSIIVQYSIIDRRFLPIVTTTVLHNTTAVTLPTCCFGCPHAGAWSAGMTSPSRLLACVCLVTQLPISNGMILHTGTSQSATTTVQ